MANQQLVDYIKGQMTAGVSEADIKKILKDAGWPDAEVEEGFKFSKGVSVASPVATSPIAASQPAAAKPMETAKAEVKDESKKESMSFDFMSNPGGMSSMPAGSGKVKDVAVKPVSMPTDKGPTVKSSKLPWIVAGVAIVLAIGVGAYFYMQSNSASSDVASLTASNNSLMSQLAALKSGSVSAADDNAVKSDRDELSSELSLFINLGASTSTPARFDLKGTIGTSKSLYTLTTARGLVLSVKNSKDPKVDAALKPLLDGTAELSGTHIVGTYEITADGLNGSPFAALVTSTVPAASTSTKPAATSTGL